MGLPADALLVSSLRAILTISSWHNSSQTSVRTGKNATSLDTEGNSPNRWAVMFKPDQSVTTNISLKKGLKITDNSEIILKILKYSSHFGNLLLSL
jgi:hypothetical protein